MTLMRISKTLCVAFLLLGLSVMPAFAGQSASDVVKGFYSSLENTMKEGEALGFDGRYQKLEPAITKAFNLPLMARYSTGAAWGKATPEEQRQMTEAFSRFSISTYASRFKKYDGEVFTVSGEKATSVADGTVVMTQLTPKGDKPVALNYLLRPDDKGELRITDVHLADTISELATRRAEFSSVIKREGWAALVAGLNAKADAMKNAGNNTDKK